jgi:carbon-monoxide dehydrogenase medium subunit
VPALRATPRPAVKSGAAALPGADGTAPLGDLNASPDYKRHLARVLTRRALTTAAAA